MLFLCQSTQKMFFYEVDERYKVTSGWARTCPAASNQVQVCVLRCHFSRNHGLCYIIFVLGSPAQSGEHRNENPRVVGSSPTWDWLYISNRKTLAQYWISLCIYIHVLLWIIMYKFVLVFSFLQSFIFVVNIYLLTYSSLTVSAESSLKSPPRGRFDFHWN